MDYQTLRDFSGRVIGTIATDPDGVQTLRNAGGTFVGKYDPRTNLTTDYSGRTAYGNILMTLLNN